MKFKTVNKLIPYTCPKIDRVKDIIIEVSKNIDGDYQTEAYDLLQLCERSSWFKSNDISESLIEQIRDANENLRDIAISYFEVLEYIYQYEGTNEEIKEYIEDVLIKKEENE